MQRRAASAASGAPATEGRSPTWGAGAADDRPATAARGLGRGRTRRRPDVGESGGRCWAREGRVRGAREARAWGRAAGAARSAGTGAAAAPGTPGSWSGEGRGGSAAAASAGPAPRRGGSPRSLDELERIINLFNNWNITSYVCIYEYVYYFISLH